jgi:hypothetical protein
MHTQPNLETHVLSAKSSVGNNHSHSHSAAALSLSLLHGLLLGSFSCGIPATSAFSVSNKLQGCESEKRFDSWKVIFCHNVPAPQS